jgi:hypothetical protein
MRSTFRDPDLQQTLERDGYAVVQLLEPDEVASLRAEYEALGPAPGDPHQACHSSFHSYDRTYKERVDATVRTALGPHLERVFDRQRLLPCNFIMKWPGANGGFGLHQDTTLVDETQFRSVEVWVALEDTNELNGQLWMVPGSHQWLPTLRGIHAFDFPFRNVVDRIVKRHSRPVPVKAGEAVVFNHATVHFSYPNKSDTPRLVAIADLIPEEAQHLQHFGDGEGNLEAYAIDDAFWTENNPFTLWKPPPASASLGPVHFEYRDLTDEDLDALVAEGRAIDTGTPGHGAMNPAKPWCHRCGATGFEAYAPNRFVGNVTLLCPSCTEAEVAYAASAEHVGLTG